jgi:hypothetical protein
LFEAKNRRGCSDFRVKNEEIGLSGACWSQGRIQDSPKTRAITLDISYLCLTIEKIIFYSMQLRAKARAITLVALVLDPPVAGAVGCLDDLGGLMQG